MEDKMRVRTTMKAPCAISVNGSQHAVSQHKSRFNVENQTKVAIYNTKLETPWLLLKQVAACKKSGCPSFPGFAATRAATWDPLNNVIKLCVPKSHTYDFESHSSS